MSPADGRSVKEAHVRETNQMKEAMGRDSGLTTRGRALGPLGQDKKLAFPLDEKGNHQRPLRNVKAARREAISHSRNRF